MIIKVTPNAKADAVFVRDGMLCVKVSCPAQDGRANKKATELLERAFHCKATIISGQKSREKNVAFGAGDSVVKARFQELEKRKI